ncbi:MAG TPA: recombinase family protein [Microthrixaceae bacterium]|nr:recombinase family protein [Microthrixaceae bacterium]
MAVRRQSNVRTGTGTRFGRAAIYARISLDKVGEAAGVGRQIDVCRPEYERLLNLVRRREIDVIVAYHPDRLYRRLADLVELTKVVASAGVEIRTVAAGHVDLNTASGRFTAQVLGVAAEHESARIGERVSAKHRQNAERGNAHGGGRSYGHRRVAQRWSARRTRSRSSTGRRGSRCALVSPMLPSRLTHAPIGRRPKVNLLAGMCRCAECGAVIAASASAWTSS